LDLVPEVPGKREGPGASDLRARLAAPGRSRTSGPCCRRSSCCQGARRRSGRPAL